MDQFDDIDTLATEFIQNNSLNERVKDNLVEFAEKCILAYTGAFVRNFVAEKKQEVVTIKTSKKIKLENPQDALNFDDLQRCTSVALNEFCKKNEIRVGGNKKDIMERVWRFLQNSSDDDDFPKKKTTTKSAKRESHQCSCLNKKGNQCAISAFEEVNGKWFCHLHLDKSSGSEAGSSDLTNEIDEETD